MTVSFKVKLGDGAAAVTFTPARTLANRCGGLDHLGIVEMPSARRAARIPALVRATGSGEISFYLPDEADWPDLDALDLTRLDDVRELDGVPFHCRSAGAGGETINLPAAFLKGA